MAYRYKSPFPKTNWINMELTEVLILIAIIAIILVIALGIAGPNHSGGPATIKASGKPVYVIRIQRNTKEFAGRVYLCRIDNGPGAVPQYQELEFREEELNF